MFIAPLFIIGKAWKQLVGECIQNCKTNELSNYEG